jgi:hypothetical protein
MLIACVVCFVVGFCLGLIAFYFSRDTGAQAGRREHDAYQRGLAALQAKGEHVHCEPGPPPAA